MSLSQQTMLELMAYADGELEGADRARIEQLVSSNDEARRLVSALGDLGDRVHEAYEEPSAVLSNGIAGAVMARVNELPKTARIAPAVVDLAAVRRARIAAMAVAALALAAGVILYGRDERTADNTMPVPAPIVTRAPPLPTPSAPKIEVLAAAGGVDVEQLESPSHEVSVFYLPAVAAANASSVVVWIGEDDKGGH